MHFTLDQAQAQTLTPDMLRPVRGGFVAPQDLPLRRTGDTTDTDTGRSRRPMTQARDKDTPAPSRIGQIPTYGLPAASGAADSGFDSLNRTRKKPKFYPGQAKPKPPPGPGSPAPRAGRIVDRLAAAAVDPAIGDPPTRRRCRRRWPAPSTASRRASG